FQLAVGRVDSEKLAATPRGDDVSPEAGVPTFTAVDEFEYSSTARAQMCGACEEAANAGAFTRLVGQDLGAVGIRTSPHSAHCAHEIVCPEGDPWPGWRFCDAHKCAF